MSKTVEHDLKTLAVFIEVYCQAQHAKAAKRTALPCVGDIGQMAGKPLCLCEDCHKLLAHAFVKRTHCPMNPKPSCKHCPKHCYHPAYRQKIQAVMRFSGKKILLSGRLDYVFHLLF